VTDVQKLGARLGPRIADQVSRTIATTKEKTAGITHKTAYGVINTVIQGIGAEQRDSVSELVRILFKDETSPEWAQRIGDIFLESKGQWGELLVNTGVGSGVSQSFLAIISDAMAPAIQGYLRQVPNTLLDLGSAARLVAQGVWSYSQGEHEATGNGYNGGKFGALVESTYQHPGPGELIPMLNRDIIGDSDFTDAVRRQGVHPKWWGPLEQLRHYVQSPADLALGVLKGVIDHGEATAEGRKSGLDSADMSFLEDITGEPPGIQDLLFAYRRNIIDKQRLEHGIRQSRLRLEWTDVIESLRFVPISAANAVEAAVQNHLGQSEAKTIVEQNGIDPKWYNTLYETAGNPPGPMEMLDLLNRGEMSEAQVKQGLRESRLKDKYIDTEIKLRRQILTEGKISLMVAQGVMGAKEAIPHYMDIGYTHEDAAALIASASISRQARQYELTQAQIETLYLDRAVTRKNAQRQLEGLGYSEQEADLILLTKDLEREHRYFEAAINRVHASYVGHKLTDTEAKGQLDALKLAAEQEADLLALWRIEKATNVSILSVAQIQGALRRGLIDETAALDRFSALGYADDDAIILLELTAPAPKG
jgi:hypothetical protein